ncbi:hypothetical protein ACFQZC_04010 [Streptacidiphilus monticola]
MPGTPEWDAAYFTLVPPREAPRAHARRRRRVGVLPVALLGCVVAAAVLGWALLTPDTSSTAARQGRPCRWLPSTRLRRA